MAEGRIDQSVKRFRESERLAERGNTARSVEALHLAAELAVDELAARNDVATRRPDMSPHEARARASVELRKIGLVPAGFDNLLRRLNEDRKRTKYDGKPSRYDQMTLAQTQASVKLVLDNLGPEIWGDEPAAPAPVEPEPAPAFAPVEAPPAAEAAPAAPAPEPAPAEPASPEPAPAPPARSRWPLLAAGAAVVAAVIVVIALAAGGGDGKPKRRAPQARDVKTGATGRLGPASFRIDHVYTGTKISVGKGLKADGVFLVAYLQVGNSTDVLQPLRMSAFRLQTRGGGEPVPTVGRTSQTTVPLRPGHATQVTVPFDVDPGRLRGAHLLVDRFSRAGKRLGPGLAMELPLEDGVGTIKPGEWRGSTSQGLRFTMRIDRGSVIRRMSLNIRSDSGKICPITFRGVYFIDGTRFALRGDVVAAGHFSTSTEADGAVITTPGGKCSTSQNVRWTATTPLR